MKRMVNLVEKIIDSQRNTVTYKISGPKAYVFYSGFPTKEDAINIIIQYVMNYENAIKKQELETHIKNKMYGEEIIDVIHELQNIIMYMH